MKTILIAIALLFSPALLLAGILDEAYDAYDKKDYAVSLEKFGAIADGPDQAEFLKAAREDNPKHSMAELIKYWRENYGTAKEVAQFYLGVHYDYGYGVPQDYLRAVEWYAKASTSGVPEAEYNLGIIYDNGRGLSQDFAKAFYWYTRAAQHGHLSAMNNLGVMYSKGKGIPQNYVLAHQWYNLAAANAKKPEDRDMSVDNRDKVARRMTPSQISEAQYLASQWKVKE